MTMSCADGPTYQCSGSSIIRSENGVALTRSGVQVYGRSTSDMAVPNPDGTTAFGLTPASGGIAEVRIARAGDGVMSGPALLLSKLGLTWDGAADRPQIVDTFSPSQGRVELDAKGALTFSALPASSNLGFYDFATKRTAGSQANYANNRYFPRTGNPSRCDQSTLSCPMIETIGLNYYAGDWRTGGSTPDFADAGRVHNDGDVHAGDNNPGSNPPWLPGGNGPGIPFPGSKGYRALDFHGFQYGNLSTWVTQDTVELGEWGGNIEHNKNRRGVVAFGDVSPSVPAAGTVSYSGVVYGLYAPNATDDPVHFRGTAAVSVNFATRKVTVTIQDAVKDDATTPPTPVPVAFVAAVLGSANADANYMTGAVSSGTLAGGLSGRYFGPIVSTGTSGPGPAEISGVFTLSNADGRTVIGGFIGRKQ
jgi:hypothetical protein